MNEKLAKRLKSTREYSCPQEEVLIHLQLAGWWVDHRKGKFLCPYGLTRNQYNILRIVRGAGERGIPLLDIGGRMVSKMSDVSRLIGRLEKMKLLACRAPEHDMRIKLVSLTAKGAKLLAEIDEAVTDFHKHEMRRLTKKELATLNDLLAKVWD